MTKAFDKLSDFILNKMRMSHIYQPVMLIEILKKNGSASNNEIAKDMGLEDSELDNWEQAFAANTHQSLDSVYDEFSIWFASNDQSPEDELSETELRENLVEALKTLPEREAMLVQLYYVEELNVYEIAEVLEITTGRVSQIKKSAISRLREFIQKID